MTTILLLLAGGAIALFLAFWAIQHAAKKLIKAVLGE